jgi:oxalyl-CoA decarboxylase
MNNTPHFPEQVTGMYVLAMTLKHLGLDTVYGLVGIPVTEAAFAMQREGIRFVGFRHEQQAGMAAATHGYLTRTPGVLLTVSSLGMMNGLTATANATVNCYPMIQISGASDPAMVDMRVGTYEELDQLNTARPLVKATLRCSSARDIPSALARAYRAAVSGRPGGVYVDMTTPALAEVVDSADIQKLFHQPIDVFATTAPNRDSVSRAVNLLLQAKRPALVIGKGAAYCRLEDRLKTLAETHSIPFLQMSMAKGVIDDAHPLCAMACRSTIMSKADVVMVVGARLNWMLSFGTSGWNENVRFIQLDVAPEEIDVNVPIAAPVVGDPATALDMILAQLDGKRIEADADWISSLQAESRVKTEKMAQRLAASATVSPMNHWSALSAIKPILEANPDIILVNEGANTLDDTRNAINLTLPRRRVDCATWAIMGMGMGSAVGAAVATGQRVVAIEGDSAFGFSGMDFETVCRYRLPVTVIVFNNGGIYNNIGVNPSTDERVKNDPAPSTLNLAARYDKLGEAFGSAAYDVSTPDELSVALNRAIASHAPAIINVRLAANAGKESGHIGYLNPTPLIDYTV